MSYSIEVNGLSKKITILKPKSSIPDIFRPANIPSSIKPDVRSLLVPDNDPAFKMTVDILATGYHYAKAYRESPLLRCDLECNIARGRRFVWHDMRILRWVKGNEATVPNKRMTQAAACDGEPGGWCQRSVENVSEAAGKALNTAKSNLSSQT